MQIKLLVNKDNFIQSPHVTDANIEVTCELSESDIAKLAKIFDVSYSAMTVRLDLLGLI